MVNYIFPMKSITLLSQCLLLSLLILLTSISAIPHINIPRLGILRQTFLRNSSDTVSASVRDDMETYFYNQTLDHFNYNPQSYAIFNQRYVINSNYWGGANESAPIFVYLGAEQPIDGDIEAIGFLPENAPLFKALKVYIEHRFYGQSIPNGSGENRGYFNSAQAVADYAKVILYLKETLFAHNSPVMVIGASYGGTLEASESCYETIKASWSVIDEVASQPNGLSKLSQIFKTCS
ncbi:unnamed protein product [Camellia sinensis]